MPGNLVSSPVTCHLVSSPVTCIGDLVSSPVTCHLVSSPVTCQLVSSPVTCQLADGGHESADVACAHPHLLVAKHHTTNINNKVAYSAGCGVWGVGCGV